jgi:hypothetical protein
MKEEISKKGKVDLFLPLAWWSKVMLMLDRKISAMSEVYGFGSVSMEVTIHKGKVKDVVLLDKARVRQENLQPTKEKLTEK